MKKIILFDGVCNFCNFWVNFIIDRDHKDIFRFASLQSAFGQKKLKEFGLSQTDFDTFVLIDREKYFTKSTAAVTILKDLRSFLRVLSLAIYLPVSLRDPIYSLIAKNRYSIFGKSESCRIPTVEERAKFIA